jgi:hypothetical protein
MYNLKDIEIYQVSEGERRYGEVKGYLAVVDFNRPTTLDDFPWLKSVETPETFESAENLIKALYLTKVKPDPDTADEIAEIAESCMINAFERSWDLSLEFIIDNTLQLDVFEPDVILDRFVQVLEKDYSYPVKIPAIATSRMNHLSQW